MLLKVALESSIKKSARVSLSSIVKWKPGSNFGVLQRSAKYSLIISLFILY